MLQGTWTALLTPFTEDDMVDIEGLKKNVNFQIEQGVTGVLAVGTSGESPTLSWEEHNKVIETVVSVAKGRCGVMAGTGSNSTKEATQNSKHADDLGVVGCLLVDCYYNGPSSSELRDEYYAQIAKNIKCEAIPYIIPGRSGTELQSEDLVLLKKMCPNIRTVKDATGNIEGLKKKRKLLGSDFSILSGDDDLNYKIITDPEIRGNGVISVTSNICPNAMSQMVKHAFMDEPKGKEIADKLSPLCNVVTVKAYNERVMPDLSCAVVMDKYRNPLPYKVMMKVLGMPSGNPRKPLGKMSLKGLNVLREALRLTYTNSFEFLTPINDFYGVDVKMRIEDDNIWNSLL